MFLKIQADSLICFNKTFVGYDIKKSSDDLFINMSLVHQLLIKKCFIQTNVNGKRLEITRQIEFDEFVDEGILNHFTLFFLSEKEKEFKRIKKAIKALTIKGNKMASNHNGDIKNKNKGTNGTNKTYDKNQGNRGKQLNDNNKKKGS